MYHSKEENSDENSEINKLRGYIAENGRVLEDVHAWVERSPRTQATWKKCNKGGGSRKRMLLEHEATVVQELSRRKQKKAESARAPVASTVSEF